MAIGFGGYAGFGGLGGHGSFSGYEGYYGGHRNPISVHQEHGYSLTRIPMLDDDGNEIVQPKPLTLEMVKMDRRFDSDAEDDLLLMLIDAATEWCEDATGRSLMTTMWDMRLDHFPYVIKVPKPPFQSLQSITYSDYSGTDVVLDPDRYQVDTPGPVRPARIIPAINGGYWPDTRSDRISSVVVRFTSGYGATPEDIPASLRKAMLLVIGEMFERREDGSPMAIHTVPRASMWLINRYRVYQGAF